MPIYSCCIRQPSVKFDIQTSGPAISYKPLVARRRTAGDPVDWAVSKGTERSSSTIARSLRGKSDGVMCFVSKAETPKSQKQRCAIFEGSPPPPSSFSVSFSFSLPPSLLFPFFFAVSKGHSAHQKSLNIILSERLRSSSPPRTRQSTARQLLQRRPLAFVFNPRLFTSTIRF